MTKYEICFDSNGKVTKEGDWDHAFSSQVYDFDDLSESEVRKLCEIINEENLFSLGRCNSEEEIKKAFLEYTEDDEKEGTEDDIEDIDFKGEGIYVVSGLYTIHEAYINLAKETFELELEDMPDDYREYFVEV